MSPLTGIVEPRELPAGDLMPIRYMGTKKSLAPEVRQAVAALQPKGRVADLFGGVGSVTAELAPEFSVLANDLLGFAAAVLRARFTEHPRIPATATARRLLPIFIDRHEALTQAFSGRIKAEAEAGESRESLARYMAEALHAGNSPQWRALATDAARSSDEEHYQLATLYFSAGYFSTSQAIEIDSIRCAIDMTPHEQARDWLLSAWIAAVAAIVNAPGHTAQYLKPSTDAAFTRIRRQWRRRVWEIFVGKLDQIERVGDRRWRSSNVVTETDALELVSSLTGLGVGVVYADPPYTRDQYSRFYHVYETLYLYDYPESCGAGRYRSGRFTTPFSHASRVEDVFGSFFDSVATHDLSLVLSYPDNGLLQRNGVHVQDMLDRRFTRVSRTSIDHIHSTMGASKGARRVAAKENLYVCIP